MRRSRHLLRDVVILTLPLVVLLVYFVLATGKGFYSSEVKNFHGYLARNTRVGGPSRVAQEALRALGKRDDQRYLPLVPPQESAARRLDLRVRGTVLDALDAALPASGAVWRPALLVENRKLQKVEVHYRGQAFVNFFQRRKAWKIKAPKRGLVDGYRVINLSPLDGRLGDHLSFFAAREMGLPASRTRVIRLFLNANDQGLYLQEEQVDESMMRRCGRMPGDIFYGELSIPNEPKLGSNDLFWNPYLWRKKSRNNRYSAEYRPYLTELLDHVNDPALASFRRLYDRLELDEYALYFGLLSFYGDQHTDRSHNHKLFFNPLTGKFEGIIWNVISTMPKGFGVETMANRLFRKLCRDPRFLDRVYRLMDERFRRAQMSEKLLAEADRILDAYGEEALDPAGFARTVRALKRVVAARAETIRNFLGVADAAFTSDAGRLSVYTRSTASLRLVALTLDGSAEGTQLFEDRDFDGKIGRNDRELAVEADGGSLRVLDTDALLYTGRDFRAPYYEPRMETGDTFAQYRQYTSLAFLRTPYLLRAASGSAPRVVGIRAVRTVGEGEVTVRAGAPEGYVSRLTIHPWRFPAPPEPREYRFQGEVRLTETLEVGARDRFEAAPGTRFLLGPGVSLLFRSRVDLRGIRVERLDPSRPWGVVALQGPACSGSRIADSVLTGGSHAMLNHVYYSGMLSVHHADHVVLKNCVFAANLMGDDTVRFARCRDLRIEGCKVSEANGDAIDCDISDGVIADTEIVKPRNDGIDLMTSQVRLLRDTISGAGDKGISLGEGTNAEITDCKVVRCVIGLGIKDGSDPVVLRTEVRGCRVGVSSYDKNWRYPGGGRGKLVECELVDNGRTLLMDRTSTLRLERCVVGEDFQPPDAPLKDGRLELVGTIRARDLR